MNIKNWLESGTNLEFKEIRNLKILNKPFNIFVDEERFRGSDSNNNIIEHNVVIEHYSETLKDSEEKIIESFLNDEKICFEKNSEWLQDEKLFVTIYELDTFLEKIRKEDDNNAKKK